jgi:hypothetical protein
MGFLHTRVRQVRWIPGAAAIALLLAAALSASEAPAEIVAGRGELRAAGNGLAALVFRGQATVRGVGLLVAEAEAIADTRGVGRITPLGDGRVLLEGFGRVTVRSLRERTRLEVAGARLRLRAHGVGVAVLQGTGVYHTEDRTGRWGPERGVAFDSSD